MSVDAGFDALEYSYAEGMHMLHHLTAYAERDLWCAVIAQAFVDIGAILPVGSSRAVPTELPDNLRYHEAIRWLLGDKQDFSYICELAGVSPAVIRRAAQVFHGRMQFSLGAVHMDNK